MEDFSHTHVRGTIWRSLLNFCFIFLCVLVPTHPDGDDVSPSLREQQRQVLSVSTEPMKMGKTKKMYLCRTGERKTQKSSKEYHHHHYSPALYPLSKSSCAVNVCLRYGEVVQEVDRRRKKVMHVRYHIKNCLLLLLLFCVPPYV